MMIKEILKSNNESLKKALFLFNNDSEDQKVLLKFNLWARYFFPQYFSSKDAPFHEEMDRYNLECYRKGFSFVNIAFRGGAKTARTKLFFAFAIANDENNTRKYIKVLAEDGNNSKQVVTDVYNMLITVKAMYPEIFKKTEVKREETMGSFTTSTGVKVLASTVGTGQRGAIQEETRPDLIWFDDFEDRKTLRSAVRTKAIWDNMEEARTSLAKGGSCIYTCNYLSESGNVHRLVEKYKDLNGSKVLIIPIIEDGKITWDRYTMADIDKMKDEDDDFEGERLCKPSAKKDIYFDRERVDRQEPLEPIKEINNFKIYREYNPSHTYASGHDVSYGVGLDSSTSVIIDFSTYPCEVVATYNCNTIIPDLFGYEVQRQSEMFGDCLVAPENNDPGKSVVTILRQLDARIYEFKKAVDKIDYTKPAVYGWMTNSATKPRMLSALKKAVEDGHLLLNDPDLINEVRGYTRNDVMDKQPDPRLATRHYDLLIACAIAWQMKDENLYSESDDLIEDNNILDDYGGIVSY